MAVKARMVMVTAVAVVAVLLATATAQAEARPSTLADRVKENFDRLMALWEKGPQPRAIDALHFLKDLHPSEAVQPRQTVLHRCDELACCGKESNPHDHRCEPQVEMVNLVFRATVPGTPQRRSIEHLFENHTRCDCVWKEER